MTSTDYEPDLTDFEETPPLPAEGRSMPSNRTRVEMLDGTTFTVRVTQRDYIQWDLYAPKRKLPKAADAPFLAQAFVTWVAAKREGRTALPFEAFRDALADVEDLPADESDVARPTRRGAGPGSS